MSWGRILTSQKCPVCGENYPSSKGDSPIECCKTQPIKFQIQVWWKGRTVWIVNDREGKTLDSFRRANLALSGIRADHRNFDPEIYRKQSKTVFKAFWGRFLAKYKKGNQATYDKTRSVGEHHILPFFGEMQIRDLRAFHIDDWWENLKEKGLAPKTLNDIHETHHRFLSQAEKLQIIEKMIPFPEKMTLEKKHIPWFTKEQQGQILGHIPAYDHPIYRFLFLTGVRVNEATGLQKGDILWHEGQISICHTIGRDGELGPTKGKNTRPIPLTPSIVATVKGRVEYLSPYVFINRWGRRYSDDYLRDTFYRACDLAGLPRIHLKNASRSSWGKQNLMKGHSISMVKEGYGHSDDRVTKMYAKQIASDFKGLYEDEEEGLNNGRNI